MVSPSEYGPVEVTVLTMPRPGFCWIGVSVSLGGGVSGGGVGPSGGVGGWPVVVALLSTSPASTSAGVTACVAAQVSVAFGASVAGCAGVHTPSTAFGSLIETPVSVTSPVLVASRQEPT